MRIRNIFLALAICAFAFACNDDKKANTESETKKDTMATSSTEKHNVLSDAEKNDGWILLFDGSSKKGWHIYNNKSNGAAWDEVDGTLHLDPKESKDGNTVGGGDIVTEDEFENFDLKLEWKLDSAGNSGIIFLINEDPKFEHSWHTGPEIQVLDNAHHGDAAHPKHRAGDLYDLVAVSTETVRPAGEWNQVELKVNNGLLEEWLNGTKVLNVTIGDDNWKKLVANSKFKDMKDFGTFKKGRIGLQDHGNKVWYRNIRIKKL